MPDDLTKRQIDLARHALGFDGRHVVVSYRNSFVADVGHEDYDDWHKMTLNGWAKKYDGAKLPFGGMDLFKLTTAGAKAVLMPRERLDAEDFPDAG